MRPDGFTDRFAVEEDFDRKRHRPSVSFQIRVNTKQIEQAYKRMGESLEAALKSLVKAGVSMHDALAAVNSVAGVHGASISAVATKTKRTEHGKLVTSLKVDRVSLSAPVANVFSDPVDPAEKVSAMDMSVAAEETARMFGLTRAPGETTEQLRDRTIALMSPGRTVREGTMKIGHIDPEFEKRVWDAR